MPTQRHRLRGHRGQPAGAADAVGVRVAGNRCVVGGPVAGDHLALQERRPAPLWFDSGVNGRVSDQRAVPRSSFQKTQALRVLQQRAHGVATSTSDCCGQLMVAVLNSASRQTMHRCISTNPELSATKPGVVGVYNLYAYDPERRLWLGKLAERLESLA